ncbi:MAG: ACP S-malonyltransferase [Pseudomonadota bacterium]
MAVAFIFPGQGSQAVGMGRELSAAFGDARAVFDEVNDALGLKLTDIMWDGPKDALTLTENAQPALMAVSVAAQRVLASEFGIGMDRATFVAGHSLGEYSALAAAGALDVSDAARLLRLRGQAMQAAVPVGEGAMVALLGGGIDAAQVIAAEAANGDVLEVANDNEPTQVVLSGHASAAERVPALAKAHGVRRALPLPVSAPFHCSLMQPAATAMAEALAETKIAAPAAPVVANVTAAPTSDPAEIRDNLVAQVTGTVRWRECVLAMKAAGVTDYIELGAGKVLGGLVKRIDADARAASAGAPEDFAAVRALIEG